RRRNWHSVGRRGKLARVVLLRRHGRNGGRPRDSAEPPAHPRVWKAGRAAARKGPRGGGYFPALVFLPVPALSRPDTHLGTRPGTHLGTWAARQGRRLLG